MHNGRKRRPGAVRLPLLYPGVNFNASRDRREGNAETLGGEEGRGGEGRGRGRTQRKGIFVSPARPGIRTKFDDARIREKTRPLSYILGWLGAPVTKSERDGNRRRRGITRAFTPRDDTRPRMNLALITANFARARGIS